MKIFLTGATGFVGMALVPSLLESGHQLRCFVRCSSDVSSLIHPNIEIVRDDEISVSKLSDAIRGQEVVVHLAHDTNSKSIDGNLHINQCLASACCKVGVRRVVAMSSTAACASVPSEYGKVKQHMESLFLESKLEFTILRPGLIYGPGRRGVFARMVQSIEKFPIVPIFGNGDYPLHYVWIKKLIDSVFRCLRDPVAIRNHYDLASAIPFERFVNILLEVLDVSRIKLHIPIGFAKALAGIGEALMKNPPFRKDQISGLMAERKVDIQPAIDELDFIPDSEADLKNHLLSFVPAISTGSHF